MNPILQGIIDWVEANYPGSTPYINFALKYLGEGQVIAIIMQALADWQKGMSFIDILKDLLNTALQSHNAQLP